VDHDPGTKLEPGDEAVGPSRRLGVEENESNSVRADQSPWEGNLSLSTASDTLAQGPSFVGVVGEHADGDRKARGIAVRLRSAGRSFINLPNTPDYLEPAKAPTRPFGAVFYLSGTNRRATPSSGYPWPTAEATTQP